MLSTHQKVSEERFSELEQSIVPHLDDENVKEVLPSLAGIKQAIFAEDEALTSNDINTELLGNLVVNFDRYREQFFFLTKSKTTTLIG